MNEVWIVSLVDCESSIITHVCSTEDIAKEKWQEQVKKQISNLKEMIAAKDEWLPEESIEYYLNSIKMYENLTLKNIENADYSWYIPIITKYEVL